MAKRQRESYAWTKAKDTTVLAGYRQDLCWEMWNYHWGRIDSGRAAARRAIRRISRLLPRRSRPSDIQINEADGPEDDQVRLFWIFPDQHWHSRNCFNISRNSIEGEISSILASPFSFSPVIWSLYPPGTAPTAESSRRSASLFSNWWSAQISSAARLAARLASLL